MANPEYIVNPTTITTTRQRPPVDFALTKITVYNVVKYSNDIVSWQNKSGLEFHAREGMSDDVIEILIASNSGPGMDMTREKFYSAETTNTVIFKMLQCYCRPRDILSFCKLIALVRFRGSTNLTGYYKAFPAYYQALLLYIREFRLMFEFMSENNGDNVPKTNFKEHGIMSIFFRLINPPDWKNYLLLYAELKFTTAYQFFDKFLGYAQANNERFVKSVSLQNKYRLESEATTFQYRGNPFNCSRSQPPARVHEMRTVPALPPLVEHDLPTDDYSRYKNYLSSDPEPAAPSSDQYQRDLEPKTESDSDDEGKPQTLVFEDQYEQELGDFQYEDQQDYAQLCYTNAAPPRPKPPTGSNAYKGCFKFRDSGSCPLGTACPWSHDPRVLREDALRDLDRLKNSFALKGNLHYIAPAAPAQYRYNQLD